jgi:hypothetical protein
VQTNTALRDQIKEPILKRLEVVEFSQSRRLATLEETLGEVDIKKREVLESVPEFMKKKMAVVFEQQKVELRRIHPILQQTFKRRICDAFAATFKINSLILLLGVLFALFCEPWKK